MNIDALDEVVCQFIEIFDGLHAKCNEVSVALCKQQFAKWQQARHSVVAKEPKRTSSERSVPYTRT